MRNRFASGREPSCRRNELFGAAPRLSELDVEPRAESPMTQHRLRPDEISSEGQDVGSTLLEPPPYAIREGCQFG
jgi:hypothetical protein